MKWSHQLAFALCSSSIPDVLLSFYNGLLLGPPNCPPQWVRQTLAHAGSVRHAVMHSTYRTAQQHAKSSFQKAYNSPDDFDVLQLYYDAPKWFFLISLLGIHWICWMILVSFIVSGKFLSHNVARYFLCFILSLKLKFLLNIYIIFIYNIYIYTHIHAHIYVSDHFCLFLLYFDLYLIFHISLSLWATKIFFSNFFSDLIVLFLDVYNLLFNQFTEVLVIILFVDISSDLCFFNFYLLKYAAAAAAAKLLHSCPTLCDPIDGSPPGSPVRGIFQARTLEWVAISFSNAWKWKLKVKSFSFVRLFVTPWTSPYWNIFSYFYTFYIYMCLITPKYEV